MVVLIQLKCMFRTYLIIGISVFMFSSCDKTTNKDSWYIQSFEYVNNSSGTVSIARKTYGNWQYYNSILPGTSLTKNVYGHGELPSEDFWFDSPSWAAFRVDTFVISYSDTMCYFSAADEPDGFFSDINSYEVKKTGRAELLYTISITDSILHLRGEKCNR